MELRHTRKVLDDYGRTVVAEMKTRLRNAGKVASETLYDSLDYQIVEDDLGIGISFLAEDYYIYVDKGRRPGKQPPLASIRQWCTIKGIDPKAAFPIARAIGIRGIKPTNFFTIPTTRRAAKFLENLELAYAKDVEEEISKTS